MPTIHPSAEVHPSAELGTNVCIDAGACIEAHVRIGNDTHIGRNTIIWKDTIIGARNKIYPFCSLGGDPQDKKTYDGKAPLIIGDDNTIREYCFFNHGTDDQEQTRIGNHNWIMAYSHVAHDCLLGNHLTIANACQLAGHVRVDDFAILGGGSLYHQFRHVGTGAIIGGGEVIRMDVPPWASVALGSVGINTIGLQRKQTDPADIKNIKAAYRLLYRQHLPIGNAITAIADASYSQTPLIQQLLHFLQEDTLQLIRPRKRSLSSKTDDQS